VRRAVGIDGGYAGESTLGEVGQLRDCERAHDQAPLFRLVHRPVMLTRPGAVADFLSASRGADGQRGGVPLGDERAQTGPPSDEPIRRRRPHAPHRRSDGKLPARDGPVTSDETGCSWGLGLD